MHVTLKVGVIHSVFWAAKLAPPFQPMRNETNTVYDFRTIIFFYDTHLKAALTSVNDF